MSAVSAIYYTSKQNLDEKWQIVNGISQLNSNLPIARSHFKFFPPPAFYPFQYIT